MREQSSRKIQRKRQFLVMRKRGYTKVVEFGLGTEIWLHTNRHQWEEALGQALSLGKLGRVSSIKAEIMLLMKALPFSILSHPLLTLLILLKYEAI